MPRKERNVVEGVDNRSFQMRHHLQVVDVLDVVTLYDGDSPIHHHVFGMESAEHGLVEVHDFNVDVGELIGMRYSNRAIRVCILLRFNWQVVLDELEVVSAPRLQNPHTPVLTCFALPRS